LRSSLRLILRVSRGCSFARRNLVLQIAKVRRGGGRLWSRRVWNALLLLLLRCSTHQKKS
jgi:hypothetical protein